MFQVKWLTIAVGQQYFINSKEEILNFGEFHKKISIFGGTS